ncbi:hypothetical protein ACFZDK_49050 [Streptomyces sp. NPDC007901]|uniref:hypothetical protein n=1 Tax=Streptomyces sp. NPDC007901 TaxID=3364785 RepID=UPI0036E298D2
MELMPMDLKLLPQIAHVFADGGRPPRPDTFEDVSNLENSNRPARGTWCSPVTRTGTAWTDWCANPGDLTGKPSSLHGSYTWTIVVEPLPEARIYAIDTEDDLNRLVAAFPLPLDHLMGLSAPDWEAMAAADWDAVYVSKDGFAANKDRYLGKEPSLAGWECASVLWLHPAYRLPSRERRLEGSSLR